MPFRFPACLTLDKHAGVQTAITGINEVAALDFISAAEASGAADAHIRKKCVERKILVTRGYIPAFRERRHRYYLAQTYELIEVSYRDFRLEFEEFFGPGSWKQQTPEERKRDGDESLMLEIIRNLPSGGTLKPHPYFAVIEYYRIMRNCIVHATPEDEARQKLHKNLDRLKHKLATLYGTETGKHYSFDAPNAIDNLQLDDIRLFSRSIQRLARRISDLATPSEQQMVNAVFGGDDGPAYRRSYTKLAGNPNQTHRTQRLQKSLRFRLMGRFGLTSQEALETLKTAPWPIA